MTQPRGSFCLGRPTVNPTSFSPSSSCRLTTRRLEKSYVYVFRTKIMLLIDEDTFRDAFHDSNGRLNKSILLLMGAHILKHWTT